MRDTMMRNTRKSWADHMLLQQASDLLALFPHLQAHKRSSYRITQRRL